VRGYLAIAGGLDVPLYLGSRATFPGGNFGGYQGRYLQIGDSLPIGHGGPASPMAMPQVRPGAGQQASRWRARAGRAPQGAAAPPLLGGRGAVAASGTGRLGAQRAPSSPPSSPGHHPRLVRWPAPDPAAPRLLLPCPAGLAREVRRRRP
jgi:hypothetical protein